MSENNNDLNEVFEEEIDPTEVITVPIDSTLQNSNEAADAKAVGDALALKADKTELQTAVKVNGQQADAQGLIIVTASDTKMSSTDNTTVKAAIENVDGKTAEDIYMSDDGGAKTIAQEISDSVNRKADDIQMSSGDPRTVKAAIGQDEEAIGTLQTAVAALNEKTGGEIPYQIGSEETIKQHVDALEAGKVKTVNEVGPDANGNINLERVPYADNLYTEDGVQVDAAFLIRTTGGTGSLSDGNAWAQKLMGNRVHTGYTAEAINMTISPMPRTAPAAITAAIDNATFEAAAGTAGTYEFNYTASWDVDPSNYGITVSNIPINGDEITVVWDGVSDPVMTVDAATRTAPPVITATINRDTWVGEVGSSGTYTFNYTTEWKLSDTTVDLADYGITVTNDPIAGDQISVAYTKEVRGTITPANPSSLVATGWNLYDHAHGYARCVKYSNLYGYAISGTYTSLAFAETPSGTQTAITPDEDGIFGVPGTGYIIVTGGNGTDTAIWPTWSDWDEGYDGSWQAYSESVLNIATIMSSNFPYGLLKVGEGLNAVCDEIDFVHKQAISRISRVAYSAEARAAAAEAGRPYEFDENYIYQVRATEVTSSITIDEEYQVSEHGLEWFTGTTVDVYAEILYGSNLKDKLRRDVVTISKQVLTNDQKKQVRGNIGAADAAEIGKVVNGNTCSDFTLNKGDYVIVKNSTISGITDGLYTYSSSTSKSAGTAVSAGELTAVSGGGLNELNSKSTANVTSITNFTPNSAITLVKQGKVCYAYFALEATSDINCTSDFVAIADVPSGFIPAENTANVLPIFYNPTFKTFQVRVSTGGKFQLYGLYKLASGETIRGQLVYFVS